ncbi:TetR/AcrR family transcriptional regulator [Pseudohoeflea coraliihabitans]|uniref:TetR/AcrR family transcriptional regulator n=1 Tax=Pseudohoeflea coraliihabitans TaxID=2860393 RepID=A0ABS6WQK3_9HYPH|nr:TetR/AcrR family transcriptional regulator [Pseudohoeflea sp. DP4N28-3]MBW3098256.1 TetR/AcrR family transcriptional regulator [Pseudohoeflea sp. DP4N28-3]
MTSPAKPHRYRRQQDSQLSRLEILKGAALCFQRHGFAATSLDAVAAAIGSTKGRIYHHYASKADVFFDVYRAGMAANFEAIEPLITAAMPPGDRLAAMCRAHVMSVIRTQPFQKVVAEGVELMRRSALPAREHATLEELAGLRDAYAEHFLAALQAARRSGDIDFLTPKIALNQLFSALNGPITWYTPRPGQDDAAISALADECTSYSLRMLAHGGQTPVPGAKARPQNKV